MGRRRRHVLRPRSAAVALLAVLAALVLWYVRDYLPARAARYAVDGQVLRVIDGDTFVVMYKESPDRVRFVDIAAPEPDEPGGAEATAALREMIDGRVVRLEIDSRRPRDRYGRILAKVYLGDVDVGRALIRNGYAEPYD